MEQLLVIIQQIYELLDILNSYTQGGRRGTVRGGIHVSCLKLKSYWGY